MVQSDPELASENRNLHIEKKRMKMLLHYQDGDSNPNDLPPRQHQQGKEQKVQIQNFFRKNQGTLPDRKKLPPGLK